MMAWAVVSSLTALAKDFKGLLLVRDGQRKDQSQATLLYGVPSVR